MKLLNYRRHKGMTVEDVAIMLGNDADDLRAVESWFRKITDEQVAAVAPILGE